MHNAHTLWAEVRVKGQTLSQTAQWVRVRVGVRVRSCARTSTDYWMDWESSHMADIGSCGWGLGLWVS